MGYAEIISLSAVRASRQWALLREQLQAFAHQLQEQFELNPSAKHMAHRELGRLDPTPALKYRAAA